MNQRQLLRYTLLTALFGVAVLFGLLLWNQVNLPYKNPTETYGHLAANHINKSTNTARYLVFMLVPTISLLIAFAFKRKRTILFSYGSTLDPKITVKPPYSKNFGLVISVFVLMFIAGHYYHLDSMLGSAKPEMDHFHQGAITATVVSAEHDRVAYKDYFPSRGMFVDVAIPHLAFALFGRSQASIYAMYSMLMVAAFCIIGWLLLLMYEGRYFFSVITAVLLTCGTLISYVLPTRFTERDTVYALFLVLLLIVLQSRVARARALAAGLLSTLPPLAFAVAMDRGYITTALFLVTWPTLNWIVIRDRSERRVFALSSLTGFALGCLTLGWAIDWNFAGFAQFVFIDLPTFREYVEGLEFFITPSHLRGSAYRIYCLLIQAAASSWFLYKFLQYFAESNKNLRQSLAEFVRKHSFDSIFLLLSLFAFRYALGRADRPHLAGGNSWATLFLIYIFIRYYLPRFLTTERRIFALWVVIGILGIGGASAHAYQMLAHNRLSFAYPFGITDSEMLTPEYQQALDYLKPRVNEQNVFVSLSNEGSWYYLLNQPCPVAFPEVWYASPREFQQHMITDLETKPIRYVLYGNDAPWGRIDTVTIRQRIPLVFEYVDQNFIPDQKFGSQDIWIRKPK